MLEVLDAIRKRVEDDELRALVVVAITDVGHPTALHTAGDIHYAEVIGYLEMCKSEQYAKAAGIIEA